MAIGPGWMQVANTWSNSIQKYIQHFSELNFRVTSELLVAMLLHNCKFTTQTEFKPTHKKSYAV
jgi:hypothetical protein